MVGRIDELIQRLFSFFVLPVLNVTIVSLLLHWCLADQYSISSLFSKVDIGGVTQYSANLLVAIFSGNLDTLKDLAARYSREIAAVSSQIAAVSNVIAVVVFLTVVILMFLLDRAIYYVNWFVPLDYDFDLATYGAQQRDDTRVRRMYALLDHPFDFVLAVGVVRSFLSESSVDAYRIARRNSLLRTQNTARVGFEYAKSYVCLLLLAWLLAVTTPVLNLGSTTILLAAAIALALAYLVWYANAYRALLEFDVDSFVWFRSFDHQEDRFVKEPDAGEDLRAALVAPASGGFLAMFYLKHHPAGVFFELYCIGRSLVSRFAGRGAPSS